MQIDVRLYGPLDATGQRSQYPCQGVVDLAADQTVADLMRDLDLPTELRGITFINGFSARCRACSGPDHILSDGDRVALFHEKSMWPFHNRHDVAAVSEFKEALAEREDGGLQSRYDQGTAKIS